ncbi:TadE/TadG family type IV pilus assembly protein [Wenxinia marina]|uniref:TadE-like protein n=1 Tax=Wenxinia marina DSM 24838 TaxID=1123501 RepID=A0A0D0QBM9_9RHOB|nr:hypothetical protein [Wenxinia marina]KIQ68358.1 hypothetical protein Wenmar_03005 [Wenxinia marina DSM 24838]GGL72819.1 hypothetical protein GCM10011392_29310 [Wenxinia marina]
MRTLPTAIRDQVRRFFSRDEGTITVEMLLTLPIVLWAYLGTFVFFDAYNAQAVNVRTSYTLGDALSRETGFVTPRYMDSLYELQRFLVQTDENVALRITVVRYELTRDRHRVVWSQVRGPGIAPLQNQDIADFYDRIPRTVNEGQMIMVETWVDYAPAFGVGIEDFTFEDISLTRPRFSGQVCWNSQENGDERTAVCR